MDGGPSQLRETHAPRKIRKKGEKQRWETSHPHPQQPPLSISFHPVLCPRLSLSCSFFLSPSILIIGFEEMTAGENDARF